MGLINCDKHGYAGIIETCAHVATDIDNRRYGRYCDAGTLLVCDECLHKYHLEPFQKYTPLLDGRFHDIPDDVLEAYFHAYKQMQHNAVRCSECVAVARVEQARRNGEPDPFPTFGRTLTSHDSEEIEELRKTVTEQFHFRESVVDDNHDAVFIYPGNYTQPLTIVCYYVKSESEQNRIVAFIQSLFKDHEWNQVRVRFLESEVWHTLTSPVHGATGRQRGDEVLLNEVLLNCGATQGSGLAVDQSVATRPQFNQ